MSTIAYPGLGSQPPANFPDSHETSYPQQPQPARSRARHSDPEDLTLFAMGLLSGEDFATIAQHIGHCSECRREFAHIQSDLGAYAFTIPLAEPGPASRDRLLKQLTRERKIVPVAPVPEVVAFSRSNSILSLAPDDEEEAIAPSKPIGLIVFATAGWLAAGALAASAAFLYHDRAAAHSALAAQAAELTRLHAEAGRARRLVSAINDPQAVRVTLAAKAPKAAPTGTATYDPDNGTLVFLASNLDPLAGNKVYQLWLIPADGSNPVPGENNPIAAGSFRPDDRGNASLLLPELPKNIAAKGFNLTVEDQGATVTTPGKPILTALF